MQSQWIADRYEINGEIMQSDDGVWHRAIDTSLNREVILLLIRPEARGYEEGFAQLFSEVGQVSSESFLQILNAGTSDEQKYVVFHSRKGMPLYQYVERHAVKLQTTLRWVQTAGERLLEGEKSGLPSFSVSFDNLWITDQDDILVMNYWKNAVGSRTGTIGLSQLLYQLSTLHALAPRQFDIYESRVYSILKHELPAQRDAVLALTKEVYHGNVSIAEYVATLEEVRERPHTAVKAPAPAPTAVPTPTINTLPDVEDVVEELPEDKPVFTAPIAPPAQLSRSKAEAQSEFEEVGNYKQRKPVADSWDDDEEERVLTNEERSEVERKESRGDRFKVGIMIAGIVLFFGLLTGAVLWAKSLNGGDTTAAPETEQQQPVQTGETAQPEQEQPADPANNGEVQQPVAPDTSVDNGEATEREPEGSQPDPVAPPTTEPQEPQEPEVPNVDQPTVPDTGTTDNGTEQPGTTAPVDPATGLPIDPNNPDSTITVPEGETPTDPNAQQPEVPADGTAPNLVGLTKEQAEEVVKKSGYKYYYEIKNSDEGEPGTIYQQEPAAGSEIKKGDRITFYIVRKAQ